MGEQSRPRSVSWVEKAVDGIVIRNSFAAGAGGMLGFLIGLYCHRPRNQEYLRRGLLEVFGAGFACAVFTIAGVLESGYSLATQIVITFVFGLAWSFFCQRVRAALTDRTARNAEALRKWLDAGQAPAYTPPAIATLAS